MKSQVIRKERKMRLKESFDVSGSMINNGSLHVGADLRTDILEAHDMAELPQIQQIDVVNVPPLQLPVLEPRY